MLYCLLGSYPLSWVIGQQSIEQIYQLLGSIGEKFFEAHALLLWEVELILTHMRSSALEQINERLFGCAQNLIDLMYLVKLALPIEQWILGDHLEQHAPIAPDIHLRVIVAIGHQTLRGSIPAS